MVWLGAITTQPEPDTPRSPARAKGPPARLERDARRWRVCKDKPIEPQHSMQCGSSPGPYPIQD